MQRSESAEQRGKSVKRMFWPAEEFLSAVKTKYPGITRFFIYLFI